MKKIVFLASAFLLFLSLCITSCGEKKEMRMKKNEPRNIRGVISYKRNFGTLNDKQLALAKKKGISPMQSREDISDRKDELAFIVSCDRYHVDTLAYSVEYLVSDAKSLLDDIGRIFLDSLTNKGLNPNKLVVTQLTTTEDDVRRLKEMNHHEPYLSYHNYGISFDVSSRKFAKVEDKEGRPLEDVDAESLQHVLSEVLRDMKNSDRCYVTYEAKQECFHITTR